MNAEGSFREGARRALADARLQKALDKALRTTLAKRAHLVAERPDWEALRDRAAAARRAAVADLDRLVGRLADRLAAAGCAVHHAPDAAAACARVAAIARERGVRRIVKSKSMTTEEIRLNDALEADGFAVRETDLGEYIVQLAGERPSHVTAPALHLDAPSIGRLFAAHLGVPATADPLALTRVARTALRDDFLAADMGVTAANFAVADTGTLVIVENEGNARLVTSLPRVHVVVLGIDKVLGRMEELPDLLALLPASATGQRASAYVSLIHGPRAAAEPDGPAEVHVVLLDNGRRALRDDPLLGEALACIRCGACMNVCPVFHHTGGHAYGGTYPGPIGSIVEPAMLGRGADLPFASTLCGACAEACPVRIDLPGKLLGLRRRAVGEGRPGRGERLAFALWRVAMGGAWRMRVSAALLRAAWRLLPHMTQRVMGRLGWGEGKALPPPARRAFRREWKALREETSTSTSAPTPTPTPTSTSSPSRAFTDLLDLFAARAAEVTAGCVFVDTTDELRDALGRAVSAAGESARVLVDPAVEALLPGATVAVSGDALRPDTPRAALAGCDVVVTGASALVAETGTVVITSGATPVRSATVLAQRHVVVARAADLVPDLAAALTRVLPSSGASCGVLVTGPSRTADIEKTLVLGAHGPLSLDVLVLRGAASAET